MGIYKRKKKKYRIFVWTGKHLLRLFFLILSLTLIQVAVFRFVAPPFTVNMVWERISHEFFDTRYVRSAYDWQDLESISAHLRRAVLASEDQRFLKHHGFDFEEIKVVLKSVTAGQGLRGASTISMQAARSLFLPASRSLARKFAEAWYTVFMELIWDKPRILEIYLNTVDWGTGIVGAQAGARHYFSCNADQLTREQAALMAAILPSPHKWSASDPSPYIKKRQERILADMPKMPKL